MPYASEVMRTRRQQSGMKVGAFVKHLPVSEGHYKNLEAGSKPAAIETFYVIARALGISADEVGILIADPPDQPRMTSDEQAGPAQTHAQARGAA